ncbi:hypothetical protein VMCG_06282 [Cytospora schulzeri]|uniref:non-specific serine/threonine protein kinase n=1 Tax=Cytospora schulzeri TaxID=448051 RepID=A0A423W944_9PEZI|nr:hypothetical protein VMCG_06282 [Valsa malicola]
MSTCESVDVKQNPARFEWHLVGNKTRDGRFGPVFTAIRPDTTDFITAEKLTLVEPGTSSVIAKRVVSHLQRKQIYPSQPNVVSYLGYQLKEGHIFILTEHSFGGTLRDFVQRFGAIPQCLACSILRQIILGLEQLQAQGFSAVFLDSNIVRVDNKGGVKIEAPLFDMNLTGQPLPPTITTLPELDLGQQNLRKADVWLLGIIAAQLLTGNCNIAEASPQIKQAQGSAWELPIPQGKLDEQASDFLRQCLTFDINERASISDIKGHPFLSVKQ